MYSHEERHRGPAGTNKSVSLHWVVHQLMTMLLHILAPDTILHLLLTQLELQHKATSTMIARLINPHTQLCFRLLCFRLPFCPSVVHSVTTEHISAYIHVHGMEVPVGTCTWESCMHEHKRSSGKHVPGQIDLDLTHSTWGSEDPLANDGQWLTRSSLWGEVGWLVWRYVACRQRWSMWLREISLGY